MSILSVRSFAVPALVAALSAPLATAEDQDRFLDLRVGVGSTPSPDVTEKVKGASGGSDHYRWDGVKDHGVQVDVSAVKMCLHDWGGLGGSVHLIGAQYDITPTQVTRSDGTVFSSGGLQLHYRTLGGQIAYGYGYVTSHNPEDLALYLEVMPFLSLGVAQGETSGANTGGDTIRRSGYGYYNDFGVRGGIYLTERDFLFGFTGFYANGGGRVSIDMPGGGHSRLYTEREGFGMGVEAGWRF
jgi:hypothetical protein